MLIGVACPSCQQNFNVPDWAIGRSLECSGCGRILNTRETASKTLDGTIESTKAQEDTSARAGAQWLAKPEFDPFERQQRSPANGRTMIWLGWAVIGLVAVVLASGVFLGAFLFYRGYTAAVEAEHEARQLAAQRQDRLSNLEEELDDARNWIKKEQRERLEEQQTHATEHQQVELRRSKAEEFQRSALDKERRLQARLEQMKQEHERLKAEAEETRQANELALQKRKQKLSKEAARSITEYVEGLDASSQISAREAKGLFDELTYAFAEAKRKDMAKCMKKLVDDDAKAARAIRLASFGRNYIPASAGQVTWGEAWAAGLKTLP